MRDRRGEQRIDGEHGDVVEGVEHGDHRRVVVPDGRADLDVVRAGDHVGGGEHPAGRDDETVTAAVDRPATGGHDLDRGLHGERRVGVVTARRETAAAPTSASGNDSGRTRHRSVTA